MHISRHLHVVCLVAVGCGPAASTSVTSRSSPEATVTAISTIGWTAAPPFRRGECGPDVTEKEPADRCFFFTASPRGVPLDLARFNARYRLSGRWTDASISLRQWQRDAGIPPSEMPPGREDARFPVFEVQRFCVIDVDRVAENIDIIHEGDEAARSRDRAWLREHRCD